METISPLSQSTDIIKIREYSTEWLIEKYKQKYKTDIRHLVDSVPSIALLRDRSTGYCFYSPLNIAGDDRFYQDLSKSPHYYEEWKWEHEATLPVIDRSSKILEIGCGPGGFIKRLSSNGYDISGTELNSEQVNKLTSEGYQVYNEMLDEHEKHQITYDAIVSFQVLEHIPHPDTFIQQSLNLLKPGGQFIFCVPNNDSFIRYDQNMILNLPPHHMGLWNEESIQSLEKLFPVRLDAINYEPLASYHFSYYIKVYLAHWLGDGILRKMIHALMYLPFYVYLLLNQKNIKGQSILAVFTKR